MHSHLNIFGVIGMCFAERVWIKTECWIMVYLLPPCFNCKTIHRIWINVRCISL